MINTPFNYTGSKFKLLEQILPLFDYTKTKFIDVFTGSFVVSTNVIEKYENILANDIIKELIDIHKLLINNPENIINKTKELTSGCKEEQNKYVELRTSFNNEKSPEKLWALMLTCTNNMLRFNKSFEFNQTWGKRGWSESTENKVNIFIESIKKYKDKIYLSNKNFYEIDINSDCFYYLDPPYINTEAGYNSYWSLELENKLYNYIIELDKNKCTFALSGVIGEHKNNKKSKLIDNLITKFNYKILEFNYNKVAKIKNKESKEILIYNY